MSGSTALAVFYYRCPRCGILRRSTLCHSCMSSPVLEQFYDAASKLVPGTDGRMIMGGIISMVGMVMGSPAAKSLGMQISTPAMMRWGDQQRWDKVKP